MLCYDNTYRIKKTEVRRKRLTEEIKLSQLGGYISENAAYHHGENSLMLTIIKLA